MNNETISSFNNLTEPKKECQSSSSTLKTNDTSNRMIPMIPIEISNNLVLHTVPESRKKNAKVDMIEILLQEKEEKEEKLVKNMIKIKKIVDNIKILSVPVRKISSKEEVHGLTHENMPKLEIKHFNSCKVFSRLSSNSNYSKYNIYDIHFEDVSDLTELNSSFSLEKKLKKIKKKNEKKELNTQNQYKKQMTS